MRKKELLFYNNNNNSNVGFAPSLKRSQRYEGISPFAASKGAKPIKNISDAEGLDIAYNTPSGQYIYMVTPYIYLAVVIYETGTTM